MQDTPNIVFLICDALRSDSAQQSSILRSIADDNLLFTNVFAPSTWSHTSHASIFSGELPSEHGICSQKQSLDATPLLNELSSQSYQTYGVSANTYASHHFGFDVGFDEFIYSFTKNHWQGIDPYRTITDYQSNHPNSSSLDKYQHLFKQVVLGGNKIHNVENATRALWTKVLNYSDRLSDIPYPLFEHRTLYRYQPAWNSEGIADLLGTHEYRNPFFLFSNYMSPHHPYMPPKTHQSGETRSWRELRELNEGYGHPFAFIEKLHQSGIPEDTITELRRAYQDEVRSVATEVDKLYNHLRHSDELENTLFIITSDHGEMLGERDPLGEQRIGHVDSVSDHLLTVPLIIAHPGVSGRHIESPALLQNIWEVIVSTANGAEITTENIVDRLSTDGPAVIQRPARIETERVGEFDTPQSVIDRLSKHLVIVRENEWTVLHTETGDTRVWREDREQPEEMAPDTLVEVARNQCQELVSTIDHGPEKPKQETSTEVDRRLEDLGYK